MEDILTSVDENHDGQISRAEFDKFGEYLEKEWAAVKKKCHKKGKKAGKAKEKGVEEEKDKEEEKEKE